MNEQRTDEKSVSTFEDSSLSEQSSEDCSEVTSQGTSEVDEKPSPNEVADYVAVVYFHGMGSQRRFEETSRLIESLDEFSNNGTRALFDITCHVEPSRVTPSETIKYIRTVHPRLRSQLSSRSTKNRTCRVVRFYEGYWAPITAGEVGARAVIWWLLRQALRPYTMLFGSWSKPTYSLESDREIQRSADNQVARPDRRILPRPGLPVWDWRGHARLRRSALRELNTRHKALGQTQSRSEWFRAMLSPGQKQKPGESVRIQPGDLRLLLRIYHSFESPEARREYRVGSFAEFRTYLVAELDRRLRPDDLGRIRIPLIADEWMRSIVLAETRNAFVLTSIVLAMALSAFGCLQLAALLLGAIPLNAMIGVDWTPVGIIGAAATLFGLPLFLTRYLGDVVFWCTYEETDARFKKRREILCYGVNVLKHVLKDDKCQRVVVIAHSLGTAIAHEVLLELGKDDWARTHNNLDFELCGVDLIENCEIGKIEHFVTAGSPIDKIHYFFESDPGRSHRYTRVAESIRGDMGRKPFGNNNNTPFLHWINFWDKADVISGSLESPPNRTDTEVRVDNIEVSNGELFPGAAHTTYFRNRTVLGYLFEIIYENKYSYRVIREQAPKGPGGRNYVQHEIGPGSGNTCIRTVHAFALTTPWLVLLTMILCFILLPRPTPHAPSSIGTKSNVSRDDSEQKVESPPINP